MEELEMANKGHVVGFGLHVEDSIKMAEGSVRRCKLQ